jgi:hypothetical protein
MTANHDAEWIRKEAVIAYSKMDLLSHNFPERTEESCEVAGLWIEPRVRNLLTRSRRAHQFSAASKKDISEFNSYKGCNVKHLPPESKHYIYAIEPR